MAISTVTSAPESIPLNMSPDCADLLATACAETEQITTLIGTMSISGDFDLLVRGLAMRLHSLNSVVYWALARDGSFDLEEASRTVRGPKSWSTAA